MTHVISDSLPIGITPDGIYAQACRLFANPRDGFELQRAVHLMLFAKMARHHELLSPMFCINMQRYFDIEQSSIGYAQQGLNSHMIFRSVAVDLMAVFSDAIVEISAQLQSTDDAQEIEDAHYAIGMAEVTLSNFGKILSSVHSISADSRDVIEEFFTATANYAVAMKSAMDSLAIAA
jgi:hypothetical protein